MELGFIGLGTMGASMASNLQKAGHSLVVHDINRDAAKPHLAAGARWAASLRELASSAEIVFTSLPGPPEVEAVALGPEGLLSAMRRDAVYFDLSTNSPTLVRRIHREFALKGVHMLDAPVSGGPRGARTGELALWIGGERAVFDRCKKVLDAIGDAVRTALAEVFTLGVKGGVEPLALFEAVREGAVGRRRTFDGLVDQFLRDRYEPPAFALRLAHKDVGLATSLGRELGVPMRLSNLTLEEMTEAMNRGWAGRDSRVPMLLQQERAGVSIKVEEDRLAAALERIKASRT